MAHSIETFAWDDDGNLQIKTYYPMPEPVGTDADPYAHLVEVVHADGDVVSWTSTSTTLPKK